MTRETKIGLMVAVSFLCLVGVVVATRWRRGNDATQMVGIKPGEPTKAPEGDNPPPTTSNDKGNPVVPAAFADLTPPRNLPNVGGDNGPPLVAILPPGSNNNDGSAPKLPTGSSSSELSLPPLSGPPAQNVAPPPPPNFTENQPPAPVNVGGNPPPPASNSPTTPSFPPVPSSSDELLKSLQNLKTEQEKQASAPAVPGLSPPASPDPLKKIDTNPFTQSANTKTNDLLNRGNDALNKGLDNVNKGIDNFNKNLNVPPPPTGSNPPAPAPAPQSNNNISFPPIPAPQGGNNNSFPPAPQGGNNNSFPPVPAPQGGNNNSFPPVPAPQGGNNNSFPPAPVSPKNNNVSFPPVPAPQGNNNLSFPPVPAPQGNNNNSFPPAPQGNNPSPAIPSPPMNNSFSAAPSPQGNATPFPPPPVAGSNRNAGTGFTIPAPNSAGASVAVHDLQNYQVRGGETLAGLSKAYYGSEKYADALLAFNREYGPNRNLTTPLPGTTIMLPGADYLQSRYGTMIADARLVGTGAPVGISQPVPQSSRNIGPMTPSPDATKSYRVATEGQMIWQVAVQTLGDGNRWPEILRLNPGLQTLQPIPGGTVLRMPGNAKVP